MILPASVTAYSEMWNTLPGGTIRLPIGTTTNMTNAAAPSAPHIRPDHSLANAKPPAGAASGMKPSAMCFTLPPCGP